MSWRPNPCPQHPLKRCCWARCCARTSRRWPTSPPRCRSTRRARRCCASAAAAPSSLFLNGVQLASRNVERPHAADQDRFVLPLQAGCNQLLVKSGTEDQDWTLELRLTDLAGRPLGCPSRRTRRHAGPGAARRDGRRARRRGVAAPGARGARDARGRRRSRRRAAARALPLAGAPDDRTVRTARGAAQRAVDATPDEPPTPGICWRVPRRPRARTAPRCRSTRGSPRCSRCWRCEPGHAGALMDLASFVLDDSPQPDRADELTRRALAAAPQSWRAASLRADLLRQRRRSARPRRCSTPPPTAPRPGSPSPARCSAATARCATATARPRWTNCRAAAGRAASDGR